MTLVFKMWASFMSLLFTFLAGAAAAMDKDFFWGFLVLGVISMAIALTADTEDKAA
jgi:hypothetical protein